MKKLLGSALALALLVSVSSANAELLKNFKFGGSVEVDAVSARNVTTFRTRSNAAGAPVNAAAGQVPADHIGTGQARVMLNMDWDLLDDVHAKVSMTKNNRVYGNTGSENLNGVQNNVVLDQAYFKIDKVFGAVDMTFGRQFFGEPGDLVAYWGPKYNEYGLQVTAIDGGRFDWAGEKAYVTAVMFEPAGHPALNGQGTYTGTIDIRGLIAGNKGNENVDGKVYVWNQMTHGQTVGNLVGNNNLIRNDNLYVIGGKAKVKYGGLYGSAEVAFNLGENRSGIPPAGDQTTRRYTGKALLADVGMKADVEQVGTFNPWAQFGYGSGNSDSLTPNNNKNNDFTDIATDYRPGAIYGRFDTNNVAGYPVLGQAVGGLGTTVGSNGLTNRIIYGIGVKATPKALEKLTAGLAYYSFRFANIGPDRGPQAVLTGGHRSIGQEYDLTAEWKHSENVSLKGTIGNFQAGDVIRYVGLPGGAMNSAWLSAFDVAVKF